MRSCTRIGDPRRVRLQGTTLHGLRQDVGHLAQRRAHLGLTALEGLEDGLLGIPAEQPTWRANAARRVSTSAKKSGGVIFQGCARRCAPRIVASTTRRGWGVM